MTRTPDTIYADPLDLIWLEAARELQITVRRSDTVFASWDGRGTLSIASRRHFDCDDCLAQMILHELCHALVAGPEGRYRCDWGLEPDGDRDLVQERATNRLQAALSERWGLRRFFATTTEFRAYYDSLGPDPFDPSSDPAAALARRAWMQARETKWAGVLERALQRTAELAAMVRDLAPSDSLWARSLPLHHTGFVRGDDVRRTCGTCAWSHAPEQRQWLRCRQTGPGGRGDRVLPEEQGCVRWEPRLSERDCSACGACCREGFHLVPVRPREAVRRHHPELVHCEDGRYFVPRPGGRCLALVGHGTEPAPYHCQVYGERPRACAEFPVGGDACLEARRRVGLSR